jgi:amino acid transporter
MRTLRLVNIAASAEGLRLRRMGRRMVSRAIMGAIGAVFVLFALALIHYAGIMALEQYAHFTPLVSALIVLGVDVVFALIFGLLASRSTPDRIEQEAQAVSNQARQQIAIAAATAGAFAPVARLLGLRHMSGLVIGALATRYLAGGKPEASGRPAR